MLLNRFPTEDRLCNTGFHLASRCSICGSSSEMAEHLFLLFPLAGSLWEAIFSVFQRQVSSDSWKGFFLKAMTVSFSDQIRIL